jgi:hypothetical protein
MKTNHRRGFRARADHKAGWTMVHKAGFKAEGVRGLRRDAARVLAALRTGHVEAEGAVFAPVDAVSNPYNWD